MRSGMSCFFIGMSQIYRQEKYIQQNTLYSCETQVVTGHQLLLELAFGPIDNMLLELGRVCVLHRALHKVYSFP